MTLTVEIILDNGLPFLVECECMWTGWRWELLETWDMDGRIVKLSDSERDQCEIEVTRKEEAGTFTDDYEEPDECECEVGQPSYL